MSSIRTSKIISRSLDRCTSIKASDLAEFGLTRGYSKCDHEISYGPGRTSKPHSQTCKAYIMGKLVKLAAGRHASRLRRRDSTRL